MSSLGQHFDLAIQPDGSGSFVNDCVELLGARHGAGFHEPNAAVPDPEGFMPWPTSSRTTRMSHIAVAIGVPSVVTGSGSVVRGWERLRHVACGTAVVATQFPELTQDVSA